MLESRGCGLRRAYTAASDITKDIFTHALFLQRISIFTRLCVQKLVCV